MYYLHKIINALHLGWLQNTVLQAVVVFVLTMGAPLTVFYTKNPELFSPTRLVEELAGTADEKDPAKEIAAKSSTGSTSGTGGSTGGGSTSGGASSGGSNTSSDDGGSTGGTSSGGSTGGTGGSTGGGGSSVTTFSSQCLKSTGSRIDVNGLQKSRYFNSGLQPGMAIDARDANWDGRANDGSYISWAITVDGSGPACWYGGNFQGAWDDTSSAITWANTYHHAGGLTIRMSDFLVESLRVDNQGDGIRMEGGASNFHIRGVHLSDIHDDCIENDFLYSGFVEDSLLNGCYVAFSAADWTNTLNGSRNTWRIEDSLIYLKAMNTVSKGVAPASGTLFKGWGTSAPGPKIVLKNNIFRADAKAGLSVYSGAATLTIPKDATLADCENNIFVWLGSGSFPNTLPSCFRVTTDKSVWDEAVAEWKAAHPDAR